MFYFKTEIQTQYKTILIKIETLKKMKLMFVNIFKR